jgi:hypothetical protein
MSLDRCSHPTDAGSHTGPVNRNRSRSTYALSRRTWRKVALDGGGLYPNWSKNDRELFYETTDNRIMVVDYTVSGKTFVPGKPRLWTDKRIFFPGTSNLALAPDGKRFAVFPMPEASGPAPTKGRSTSPSS